MDELQILQILLGEFYDKIQRIKDLTKREVEFPNAPNKIKVAIGIRRGGKTYFLYQNVLALLHKQIDRKAILYINLEDDRLLPWTEQRLAKLVDAFYTLYPENHDRKCYLFFDEIQNIENWPIVIRRLHDTKNAEIFLTGSSAKLLSKEIATNLRGRSLATEIWPYNFTEFAKAHKVTIDQSLYDKRTQDNLRKRFLSYLSEGGFPEITFFDSSVRQQTLQEYLDVVIYKDIIERHAIKNTALIKYLIVSLIHNVGKPFTVNKFYHDIKSQGYQVGKDLLYEYMDYIEDAYLAFPISLYDKSIRKTQANPKKIYVIDPGMTRAVTLDYENDLGRLFENIVFLDLKRLGYTIYYYLTCKRYEIDFLVQTPRGQLKLFQVAWNTQNPETLQREERALQAAMEELQIEGELVTLESYLRAGIQPIKK